MELRNKVFTIILMFMFSFFSPLIFTITEILIQLLESAITGLSISWNGTQIITMIFLTIVHFLFIIFLRKEFNKENVKYGIVGFAVLNIIWSLLIFNNPLSMARTVYQAVNFLSNVILSTFIFTVEEGKLFMVLLPITTSTIHILLNYLAELLFSNKKLLYKHKN